MERQTGAYDDYSVKPLEENLKDTPYAKLTRSLIDGQLATEKCFASTIASADAAACEAERNRAVAVLILSSEQLCVKHRSTIYGNDAAYNIVLGSFTNLFAGAASVVRPETTKSVLAALALFSNSERSLINETVYKTALVPHVDRKILQIRAAKAEDFYTKLKLPIAQYQMSQALTEVGEFHSSCSFMNGLQKALEEGTTNSKTEKIVTLRAVETEMIATSQITPQTQAQTDIYAGLKGRQAAISEELKKLETQ